MPGVGVRCCGGALLLLLVAASQITAAALEKRVRAGAAVAHGREAHTRSHTYTHLLTHTYVQSRTQIPLLIV